jgi:hypothetical protein
MTTASEKKAQEARRRAEEDRAGLSRAIEKLILVSIGALSLGQETLDIFLKQLAEGSRRTRETAAGQTRHPDHRYRRRRPYYDNSR